ncbi:MAG: hypothetical protein V3S01_10840, partial [Dehalococcoidia bacterium]
HGKLNVDRNSLRGEPTFYKLRKNLDAAVNTIEFMHLLVRLQGSIGLIRTHDGATKGQVTTFRNDKADIQASGLSGQDDTFHKQVRKPKIIDIPKGMDFEFPATKINAKDWVDVVQATIRTTASRLRLPEWMLSARLDAKFANAFAAESPFVRMIQGQQWSFALRFREVIQQAVMEMIPATIEVQKTMPDGTVQPTKIPIWQAVSLTIEPPSIEVRDQVADSKANETLNMARVLSKRTWAARAGLDHDDEQANIEEEMMAMGEEANNPFDPIEDEDDDKPSDDNDEGDDDDATD